MKLYFFNMESPESIGICVLFTGVCFFIQAAEKFIPFTLHILMPPIIPQIITVMAGCMTLLVGYPHLKERIKQISQRWKK